MPKKPMDRIIKEAGKRAIGAMPDGGPRVQSELDDIRDQLQGMRRLIEDINLRQHKKRRKKRLLALAADLDRLYSEECNGMMANGFNTAVATLSTQLAALLRDAVRPLESHDE